MNGSSHEERTGPLRSGNLRGLSLFGGHDSKSCRGVFFVESILVFPWSPYQGAEGPRLSRECVVGCVVGNG